MAFVRFVEGYWNFWLDKILDYDFTAGITFYDEKKAEDSCK